MNLCAMGETECGKSSPLAKKGSTLGKTAELACLWFRAVKGAAELAGRAGISGMDPVVSTGTLAIGLKPGL